jgi:hypothetical protein
MIAAILRRIAGRQQPPLAGAPGVSIVRGAWIPRLGGRLSGMRGPAAAVTLGNTIIVHPDVALTRRLLDHELAHVRQWARQPLSFPVRYLWHHIRHGYHNNPYEIEARAAERSPNGEHHGT